MHDDDDDDDENREYDGQDDAMPIDVPSAQGMPLEIGGSDTWESDSYSDISTEDLIGADDDDVVPTSFSFCTDSYHPSGDNSVAEELLEVPPQPQERETLGSSMVYGSDSEYLRLPPLLIIS